MLLPYHVDVPMKRVPWANWALITLTVLISFIDWQELASRNVPTINWDELEPENISSLNLEPQISSLALHRGDFNPSQLFTSILVHGDFLHLLGNMIFLFVFGNAVNARLGHILFILCYFLLGMLAALAWLVTASGFAVLGASGAIMGIVGIFLVLFPRNDIQVFYWLFWRAMGAVRISAGWVILFYLVMDFIGLMTKDAGIAYISHLVGGFAGIGVCICFFLSGWLKPTYEEENLLQVLGFQDEVER